MAVAVAEVVEIAAAAELSEIVELVEAVKPAEIVWVVYLAPAAEEELLEEQLVGLPRVLGVGHSN